MWGQTDVRLTCAKTMNPTGLDCGLAEWIKKHLKCRTFTIYVKYIRSSLVAIKSWNMLLQLFS